MTNRFTSPPPDELIEARLQVLLDETNRLYQEGGVVIQEDILDSYNEAMATFFSSLENSILGVSFPIKKGMPADPVDYNVFTSAIRKDLEALFLEASAADRLISSNFNSLVSLRDQILSMSRRIALKTADYLLYADPSLGEGFFFGDSFNSSRYLDIGSSLVETKECFLSQEEGVILLPLSETPERAEIAKYIINENSNGFSGNNQQLNSSPHNDINSLGDGEPDTWFEYERVTASPSTSPLRLDLTLFLSEPKIINMIHLDPIQFGTPTPVKIIALETSKDGKEYISVKEEIPIADFISQEEDDVFVLSGKSGKYSGEAYFSFLPRRCQYGHIVLEQSTPYSIDTNSGTRLRYAIGIKDINIYSRKFEPEGSIVSTPVDVGGDATKISMWASENPAEESTLADVTHQISYDDGATWVDIQPQGRSGIEIPEVVNLNNVETDSIDTGGEVNKIRHKITMNRDSAAFTGNITLQQKKIETLEVVDIPSRSPFQIDVQNEPIPDTVHINISTGGSYSSPTPRTDSKTSPPMELDMVTYRLEDVSVGTVRFKLPWKDIKNLEHKIRVYVAGEQWAYSGKDAQSLSNLTAKDDPTTSTDRVYFLNNNGRELQFVYIDSSDDNYGKLPGAGARIQVCLDGDNPRVIKTDMGYALQLSNTSDGVKDLVKLLTPIDYFEPDFESSTILYKERLSKEVSTSVSEKSVDSTVKGLFQGEARSDTSVESAGKRGYSPSGQKYGYVSSTAQRLRGLMPKGITAGLAYMSGKIPEVVDIENDPTKWTIREYDSSGDEILLGDSDRHTGRAAGDTDVRVSENGYIEFIDGQTEFYDTSGVYWPTRWTFDFNTGNVYFASPSTQTPYRMTLEYEANRFYNVVSDFWEYYRDPISGKIDTSKILLTQDALRIWKEKKTFTTSQTGRSFKLTVTSDKGFSYWNQRIVEGSVVLSKDILGVGVKPIEVPYIDGATELSNKAESSYKIDLTDTSVVDSSSSPLYTIDLAAAVGVAANSKEIDVPVFNPVSNYPTAMQPSQFTTRVYSAAEVDENGYWYIELDKTDADYGKITVQVDTGLVEHYINFKYEDKLSGLAKEQLFSVDYENGSIHFATSMTTDSTVTIKEIEFDVTMYSAFYNIGNVISSSYIKEVNEAGKYIELDPIYASSLHTGKEFGAESLGSAKVRYAYYEKSTESLGDLEPYFSPICKDVAIRVITKEMIGRL